MTRPTFSRAPLALAALFIAASTTSAHAYLDPGTGSMLLQLLLGGIAGLAIAAKLYWYRFLSLFGIKSKTDRAAEERERHADGVKAGARPGE